MVRLLIISTAFFFSMQTFAADCGQFKVVKGNVKFKKKSKKKFKKARINKKVCQGDLVKTAKDSRAKIIMADNNEINVSPNTELLIEVYKNDQKVVLNVLNGKVRSNVKRKYQDNKANHYRVKTKSAVAGVRGTEFMASFNRQTNQSRVVTFEGEVAVGQMQGGQFVAKVTVKPGQFTSNSPGADPHPPKEIPPKELARLDRESNADSSPRDVANDPKNEPKADQEKEPKEDGAKKDQPQKEKPKAEQPKEKAGDDGNANRDNNNGSDGVAGGPGDTPEGDAGGVGGPAADGPDGDGLFGDSGPNDNPEGGPADGGGFNPDGNFEGGGERDIASVDGGDPLGLPPPTLDDLPQSDDLGLIEPPRIPVLNNPIIDNIPDCLTCNDAVINQKVKVIIVPVLPGTNGAP